MGYADEVLADSPTAYLQLRDAAGSTTAADATGNGHAGTFTSDADGQDPQFGWPALIAGGFTCLKLPSLSSSDYIRTDSIGPSSNFTIEAIIRVTSSDYNVVIVKPSILACVASSFAGPSSNPGYLVTVDGAGAFAGGTFEGRVGGSAIPVGQRTHLAFEFTGTVGVVGAGGPRLKVYVDNTLVIDTALGTTIDLDLFYDSNYIQLSGWGAYVEEVAYYGHELSSARIGAHMAVMGDVLGFSQAVETDASGQIGYPRTFDLPQAPTYVPFDVTQQYIQAPGPPPAEIANRIRAVQEGFVPVGQAVEADTAQTVVNYPVPWNVLDLSLVNFHTSPEPESVDHGFYADGLIQPNEFGTGPGIAFTHPDFGLDDLDANTYYDFEVTYDAASEYSRMDLESRLDDSDDEWWYTPAGWYTLATFGTFTTPPLVAGGIIGPADDVVTFGEWTQAFAAGQQSINFAFSNRSYISQIRWRVSLYQGIEVPVVPPMVVTGPDPETTRRMFPPRRLAAR